MERLEKVCARQDITLHLLHAPVSEKVKENTEDEKVKVTGYDSSEQVEKLLKRFYETVVYYPEEEFRDGIHMTSEKSSLESLRNYIIDLQDASGDLRDLELE